VSRLPMILTFAGLIPFVGGAWLVHHGEGGWLGIARFALPMYAAVIVSFLAGAQWGLALGASNARALRLCLSMPPPMLAWLMLALPFTAPQNKYLLFALMLLALAVIDHFYARRGWAPGWYPALRWPASIIAAGCMVVASQF